ncbi:DUF2057 domain-containing protein [Shewanella pneumatophori]|uniref:UPF0319 protein L2740_00030 n=1 Tax=Shewanella pneumatophori TaxID=314092 RepID=A0A9X1ZAK2_9GAMM|nr:DUF2057 domain-containing protein [Shewanella pneumatophori]MCL1136965.1 DUF2057 domain-containing protein [Shewanella pneumatophori]
MNRYIIALCSSVLLFSAHAQADVSLALPSNLELVLVNGSNSSGNDSLKLNNGSNQIAFRYIGRYQQHGTQTQFKSDIIIVKFDEENSKLALTLPRIRSNSAADEFNKNPQLTIVDANDQSIHFEQGKLIKEGLQLGRDYEQEIAAYNLTNSSASLKLQAAAIATPAIITASSAAVSVQTGDVNQADTSKQQINVGQMLDFWYQQADEETRNAFKERIK